MGTNRSSETEAFASALRAQRTQTQQEVEEHAAEHDVKARYAEVRVHTTSAPSAH